MKEPPADPRQNSTSGGQIRGRARAAGLIYTEVITAQDPKSLPVPIGAPPCLCSFQSFISPALGCGQLSVRWHGQGLSVSPRAVTLSVQLPCKGRVTPHLGPLRSHARSASLPVPALRICWGWSILQGA